MSDLLKFISSIGFFWLVLVSAGAQSLQFNEVVAANTYFLDEEGDSPDWIELYYAGSGDLSLEGWTISDDAAEPDKWSFPDLMVSPDTYLVLWASGKNRKATGTARTLIAAGEEFNYLVPNQNLPASWTSLAFDDSAWAQGPGGFGYGDQDDATILPNGTQSVFLRKTFTIEDPALVEDLLLHLDYDDAFVTYLNGVEIARDNIIGNPPAYNAGTITDHEAQIYQGGQPDLFIVDHPADLLVAGENILSIQAHNISASSSDFSIIPYLTAYFSTFTTVGQAPPAVLNLQNRFLHTNFKISSSGENLYLFDPNGNQIDAILLPPLPANISTGIPAGGSEFRFYENPTPGAPNPASSLLGVNEAKIIFSDPGGQVSPLSLSLSGATPPEQIRYTLDATIPDENAPLYTSPIPINQNSVVRARIFRPNYLPSATQSHTYLFNTDHQLPIVTLVTEPDNFFDEDSGIYVYGDSYNPNLPYFGANFWEDWERPVHFTFYEPTGTLATSFYGGTKIFGGWSRANDQRSFSLFARREYGSGAIEYPLFPELEYRSFEAIVLRNAGNDWLSTNVRDVILTGLLKDSGLEYQAARSVATYINGDYWGLYHIREKVNEHFLAAKHGIDPKEITILESYGVPVQGEAREYEELLNFIIDNDLEDDGNYQYVTDRIDLQNYLTYQVAQIYFNNVDWPGNNIKYWKTPTSKWRWILFDTDFGFNRWEDNAQAFNTLNFALEPNGPGWPNPSWSTFLFRNLTKNENFRHALVNRFADALNSRFLPERVMERIDSTLLMIAPEMPAHLGRWGGSYDAWLQQLGVMLDFALERPAYQKSHILFQFGLPNYHRLTIKNEDPSQGQVQVSSLTIREADWSGDYFEEVPFTVKAIAAPGYSFSHWSGGSTATDSAIEMEMKSAMELTPHFVAGTADKALVINEINYHSKPAWDTGDWLELYNPNVETVDVSGWILQDENGGAEYIFPADTWLEGKGFLIIARNPAQFRSFYPQVNAVVGGFDFGFSSNGDALRLFNLDPMLEDEVAYLPDSPWPPEANGSGATLELRDPALDNSLPQSWTATSELGSPGAPNTTTTGQQELPVLKEGHCYPNPFEDQVFIDFDLMKSTSLELQLFHLDGRLAQNLFTGKLNAGAHHFQYDLAPLPAGMYLLKWKTGAGAVRMRKWVKSAVIDQ